DDDDDDGDDDDDDGDDDDDDDDDDENAPPVATDDSGTTDINTPVTLSVLANDSDPDGDTLGLASVSAPANGSAVINNDGTITYTPATDFTGEDSFSYTVTDDDGATDSATVTVTVEGDGPPQPLPKGEPNAYYTLTNTTSEEFFLAIGLDAQLLGDTAGKTINIPTGAIARRLDPNTTVNLEDASTDYILQRNGTTLEIFDSTGAPVTSLSASSTETSSLRFSDGAADLTFEGGNLVIGGTTLSDEEPIAGGTLSLDDTPTSSGVFTGVTDLAGSAEATAFLTLTDTTPATFTLGEGLVVELLGNSAGKTINIPQGAGADGVDPNTTLYIEGASSVFTFSRNGTILEVRDEAGHLTAGVKGSSAETSTLVFADGFLELAVADQQLTLGGTAFTDGLSVSGAELTVDSSETSEPIFGNVINLDALGGTVQTPASADAGDGALTFFDNIALASHTEINDFGADDTLMLQGVSAADVDVSVADDATTFAFDNGAGDVSQIVLLGVAGPFTSVAEFNAASDSFGDVIFA
ncbi:Ig-like domain-containing protein, partial [Halochromatium salexigens]